MEVEAEMVFQPAAFLSVNMWNIAKNILDIDLEKGKTGQHPSTQLCFPDPLGGFTFCP